MLRRSLAFEGYTVLTANHGMDGLKQILENDPDTVILDVMMPQLDGWEVVRRIREGGSDVPVLMLTAKDEVADRVKGLDLGADDYLVKPFALEELLARVRVLLRRKAAAKTEPETNKIHYQDVFMDLDTREVFRGGQRIELTTKEFELLHLFLQNPRRVLSRDVIMEKKSGDTITAGNRMCLRCISPFCGKKTEEHGHKRIIQTVRGAGYVLRGED